MVMKKFRLQTITELQDKRNNPLKSACSCSCLHQSYSKTWLKKHFLSDLFQKASHHCCYHLPPTNCKEVPIHQTTNCTEILCLAYVSSSSLIQKELQSCHSQEKMRVYSHHDHRFLEERQNLVFHWVSQALKWNKHDPLLEVQPQILLSVS